MIVPGYFALYLTKPYSVALTLLAALITYWIVTNISRVAIVYGRRRIVLMALFGFLVGAAIRACAGALGTADMAGAFTSPTDCVCVIGFIIPGLIALWMDRQGLIQTLGPLMTSSVVVRLVLILIGVEITL
jgi:poly-gamma-glutamate biosynthesis protein PgsC/CapC